MRAAKRFPKLGGRPGRTILTLLLSTLARPGSSNEAPSRDCAGRMEGIYVTVTLFMKATHVYYFLFAQRILFM